jgi:2-amino-4-hydroxy-6-hydroxymethyldihydropteridine diphosphokinase
MTGYEVFPVFISLGSNIEPRAEHLQRARQEMGTQIQITRLSSIYETEPWGFSEQACFLNQVIECRVSLSAMELLRLLKRIECNVGRKPTFRFGPREIDLDILLYGNAIIDAEDLTIPHPRIVERAFILVPLAELDMELKLPGSGLSVRKALAAIDPKGVQLWTGAQRE